MMKKLAALSLALLAAAGCDMRQIEEAAGNATVQSAEAVVVPIVMQTTLPTGQTIPSTIATAVAGCIVTSASDTELAALAGAAVTGPTADTRYIVSNILNRPETTGCAAAALSGN